jgi:hypothetical protein
VAVQTWRLTGHELTGAPHDDRPAQPAEAKVARPVHRLVRRQDDFVLMAALEQILPLVCGSHRVECHPYF